MSPTARDVPPWLTADRARKILLQVHSVGNPASPPGLPLILSARDIIAGSLQPPTIPAKRDIPLGDWVGAVEEAASLRVRLYDEDERIVVDGEGWVVGHRRWACTYIPIAGPNLPASQNLDVAHYNLVDGMRVGHQF